MFIIWHSLLFIAVPPNNTSIQTESAGVASDACGTEHCFFFLSFLQWVASWSVCLEPLFPVARSTWGSVEASFLIQSHPDCFCTPPAGTVGFSRNSKTQKSGGSQADRAHVLCSICFIDLLSSQPNYKIGKTENDGPDVHTEAGLSRMRYPAMGWSFRTQQQFKRKINKYINKSI